MGSWKGLDAEAKGHHKLWKCELPLTCDRHCMFAVQDNKLWSDKQMQREE